MTHHYIWLHMVGILKHLIFFSITPLMSILKDLMVLQWLHYAAENGHLGKFLLSKNAIADIRDNFGYYLFIVDLFISKNASVGISEH